MFYELLVFPVASTSYLPYSLPTESEFRGDRVSYDYDLFVIGAGSGGVRVARMAAAQGVKVAVAEERYLGGTCVNVGCVPKKLFVYGSHFSEDFEAARGFGWNIGAASFNWAVLRDNKTKEIERLNDIYRDLLSNSGATLLEGRATIIGPHRVRVNGQYLSAERILIAVGGWPHIPSVVGAEHIISSNEVFALDTLPEKIAIVGGGYIAVEFAGIFNGLGVETHLIYRGSMFLRGFDDDVRNHLAQEMKKKGVFLHFDTQVTSIEKVQIEKARIEKVQQDHLRVALDDGSALDVGQIMYATGRKPKSEGLGLESTAVKVAAGGAVEVDEFFQTAEPSIYALGDVVGHMELTPVALAEGVALVKNLFGESPQMQKVDYTNIPTAVFSQPNVADVGYTEAQAREQFARLAIYETDFRHMKHTLGGSDERTFMKLIVDRDTDKVVGCHMVGSDAGEIIQGIAIAMKAGATKADFDSTLGIHPTAAEEFVTMREVSELVG